MKDLRKRVVEAVEKRVAGRLVVGQRKIEFCAHRIEKNAPVVGKAFHDERIATERKVRAVLLGRTDRNDEPGVSLEVQLDRTWGEPLELE